MSGIKVRPDKIAIRYGGVLFDLAHKENAVKAVLKDLNKLRSCMDGEPADWLRVVSPSLPRYTQHRIINSLSASLKLSKVMGHFLGVLCQNRRLSNMDLIFEDFLERMKRAEGIMDGVLETAIVLSAKEVKTLEDSLSSQLGKKIQLHQELKESLLGGVVLRLGSLMIDGSTKTRLDKLKTVMKG